MLNIPIIHIHIPWTYCYYSWSYQLSPHSQKGWARDL